VLTGASAGGMTAAMVSQRLMYDWKALTGEFTNALYHAWVERISLMGLVKMGWKEKRWHSLFSSDLITRIGDEMLVQPMQKQGSGPHPAVEQVGGKPETLRVGLALTNLNGVNYMIPIAGSVEQGFNYTTSVDQKLFEVTPGAKSDRALWERLRETSVACGAFPVAFRPQPIKQSATEFGTPLPVGPAVPKQGESYVDWNWETEKAFACSDGGVLQNQPLGIAKNLVDDVMAGRVKRMGAAAHADGGDRLYVFVSPNAVKSTAQDLVAGNITIWRELRQLVRVYLRQATFHDWIVAEGVNQQVRALDERASELAEVMARGLLDLEVLAKASGELNAMLMPNHEQQRLDRLRVQYRAEYDRVASGAGPAVAEVFLSSVATLEAAAKLENRDKMKIVAVIADGRKELAGSGMAAFVGFFRRSFREYDYWVGRVKTREYLKRSDVKKILGVVQWPERCTAAWAKPPENRSKVKLPLRPWNVWPAAIVPAGIMLALRPIALLIFAVMALLAGGAGAWVCHLVRR
jgi:hypothetical protein